MLELLTILLVSQPLTYERPPTPIEETPTILAEVSAYSAEVGQTDERPRETASGIEVREGIIACPSRYEFGTKVEVLGKIYQCEDRMNRRYRSGNYFDVFFEDTDEAWNFGRQQLAVKIWK